MANVLPPQSRFWLRRNYWLRVGIVAAVVVVVAMLIGIVTLFPAYVFSRSQLKEVQRNQGLQKETREVGKNDPAIQTARLVSMQIQEATKAENTSATNSISRIMRDWETHADDVIISGFTYTSSASSTSVRLSGEARSRGVLNAFVQTLRADSAFKSVSFPVSDLAGEGIVEFSLVIGVAS